MLILSLFSPGFNCWTSVIPACFSSVLNLDLYVCCFDSLMSSSPSGEPNNLYVFAQGEPRARVARALNRFKPPSNLLLIVPRWCFCCWFILIVVVYPLPAGL